MTMRERKRLRAARLLGLSGLLLSLLFVAGVWIAGFLAYAPVQATLAGVKTQLGGLDSRLAQVETTVAPLDSLVRPEAQSAVQTLSELARTAQRTPLIGSVFGEQNLQNAADLAAQWQTALSERLPIAQTLNETRMQVQGWQTRITQLEGWLRLGALALGALLTLLGGWSAAGQWALYRLASQEMRRERL